MLRKKASNRAERRKRSEAAMRTRSDVAPTSAASSGVFLPAERVLDEERVRDELSRLQRSDLALQASETRYRRLFESAKDGILILDADSGEVIDVNPYLAELLGDPRAEFLGKQIWDFGPFKDIVASQEVFAELQSKDYVAYEDLPLETSDGRHIDVGFVSNVYLADGKRTIQCNIRDITKGKLAERARLNLEEQLRATQKLEAIGSLAGGVAHDFNNLLSVVLCYTGFALDSLPEGSPVRADLFEIEKASQLAITLTRQLLAFSRKQVLQPVPLELNEVVRGVEKMLTRILGEDIALSCALASDLGLVTADPSQIEQVIMNLVVNARDAMPTGGKLTIDTENVELDREYAAAHVGVSAGSYVVLAITDTGIGMDAATRARLFEPFFTTKEPGKGTGLGLSTVYGIVKQSGGNVWAYSEPGQGTTFKVYLRRESAENARAWRAPDSGPSTRPGGTETILIVEDEEAVRKVAKRILSAVGYKVLTASNAHDALLLCEAHVGDLHLLLTDVIMPQMNGRVLSEQVSKSRPGTKLLFMSGYSDDAILHQGILRAGAGFISKPFSATALTRKVREILDQEALAPSPSEAA